MDARKIFGIKIIGIDNNLIYIGSKNDSYIQHIKNHFTNIFKAYKYSDRYKSGNWDGQIRFFKNSLPLPSETPVAPKTSSGRINEDLSNISESF